MYLPCLGSHLTIMLVGSKTAEVILDTDNCSWYAFSAAMTGGKRTQWKVNSWVGDQIGLEGLHVDTDDTVETKGGCDGGDRLGDQTIQIGVGGALNIQVAAADVIQGFVVDVGVFEDTDLAQDVVVWFDNGVIHGETFQQQGTKTGTGTTTKGVVDDESWQTGAVVGQFTKAVQDEVHDFFTNGVVTTGVIVGGVFFAGDPRTLR